jgi:hypothetical protein
MPIVLSDVLSALAEGVEGVLARQVTARGPDVAAASRRAEGGVMRPDWGIAEPTGTCGLLAACGMLLIARATHPDETPASPDDATLLARMASALRYLRSVQRPSGLMDLRDCNYDSSPDAGFAVQALCPVIELGRWRGGRGSRLAAWDGVLAEIEGLVRGLTVGMLDGGFHTPNHRWVMSAAMAWAGSLFPDLAVEPVIAAYVAEGYDADADGAFIERSAGVYDAICDRSLLILWERRRDEAALRAALANLDLNLHMLHPDGTVEAGASRRQDSGTRPVPATMALAYLMADAARPDARYAVAADMLWRRSRGDASGLAAFLLAGRGRAAAHDPGAFPFDFRRLFPSVGLWRSRRGAISAAAFGSRTRLLTVVFGEAELSALKISQSYFGTGRFVGDGLTECENGCVLRSDGDVDVHRPGYDFPLGRPIEPTRWFETRPERDWRPLPRCVSEVAVTEAQDGLDVAYRTLEGMPGVTAQMALDFPPGGIWETSDTCLKPQAGQVLFLKAGRGAMRYGHDVIEVGPGADAHRMWAMRDAEAAPAHVRVLLTFETPVDHLLQIRCRREP